METEGLEGAASAAESGLAADAVGSGRWPNRVRKAEDGLCANCGASLEGPYCHACGQHDADLRQPFWTLFSDIVEGLFSLDGRVLRTMPALMLQPGRMTARYLAGERARYVQPFRLYLIASVLFFVSLALLGGEAMGPTNVDLQTQEAEAGLDRAAEELSEARQAAEAEGRIGEASGLAGAERALRGVQEQAGQAAADAGTQAEDAVASTGLDLEEIAGSGARQAWKDEVRASLLPETMSAEELAAAESNGNELNIGFAESMSLAQRQWLHDRIERVIDEPSRLWAAMQRWAPRLMFVLLPIYALTLAGMHFWRRDFVFYDHLIVSLHAHAFLFLLMTLLVLISLVGAASWALIIFFLWSNFYVYRLHRRVYRHGRVSSVLRTLILDTVYFIVLVFALIALFFVGVAFV